jgi:mannosylglucosylglycerate synthase
LKYKNTGIKKMNIALAHFRVGETDGVSLEMDKWKIALEKMGHKVYMLAGSEGNCEAYVVPELHYKSDVNNRIVKNAYGKLEDYADEEELKQEILDYAYKIQVGVEEFLTDHKIDILVPNNIWSLGWGLPAGIGIYNAVKKLGVKCVAHNHDFHWERVRYSNPTCNYVKGLLDTVFPPNDPLIKYVTINELAKGELKARRGLDATVVPNVFDFKAPLWEIDDYNKDFRKAICINKDDILILQATRIAERKAIELAIDVIGEMHKTKNLDQFYSNKLYDGRKFNKESKLVFVMAGLPEAEEGYIEKLNAKAEGYGVKVLYVNDVVEHSRCNVKGKKCYSLWDVYAHADIVTYPSVLEGWGNQFLEAIFAKKPVIVYEYPVYGTDIKERGFDIISLGDTHTVNQNALVEVDNVIIENAAKEAVNILIDNEKRKEVVEKNFAICEKYFSYESLEAILSKMF